MATWPFGSAKTVKIVDGLSGYLDEHRLTSVRELVGSIQLEGTERKGH